MSIYIRKDAIIQWNEDFKCSSRAQTTLLLSENTSYRPRPWYSLRKVVISYSYKGHNLHPWAKHKVQYKRETRELVRFPDYARLLSHFCSPVFQYKLITNTALTVSNSTKLTTIQPSLNSYCFSDISYQSRTVEHERIQQGIPLWDAQPILLCIHSRPHKAPYQATESSEILLISWHFTHWKHHEGVATIEVIRQMY